MHTMTKRQAISEVRALADACIEQMERVARGWDKGDRRDDDLSVRVSATLSVNAQEAMWIARQFA
jgi:O-phosphoseryl-tRNA(Cys) synthetase